MGCCAMMGDYYDDSSIKENLNLLLRLARVETNIDSKQQGGGILEGLLQGTRMLGASTATPDNRRLFKEFQGQGFLQRSTHSEVAQRLREIQVKPSRFKLEKSTGSVVVYIYGDPAHGPSSVPGGKTKTDITGKVVRAIEEEEAV